MCLVLAGAVMITAFRAEAPFGQRSKSEEEASAAPAEATEGEGLSTADDLEKAIKTRRSGFKSSKKSLSEILEEGGLTLEEWEREKAAQAQMRITQVEIPDDLLLEYDWSLPFKMAAIKRDGIWARRDILLVLTTSNSLYAIDRINGKVEWKVDLRARPMYVPTVTATAVYVVVENYIVAIDKVQGQIIWRRQPEFPVSAAPLVLEPNIFIPSWDGKFYCLETIKREKVYVRGATEDTTFKSFEYDLMYRWHHTTGGHIVAPATEREGVLYFGSEDGFMYSISRDGEMRFQFQTQGKLICSPVENAATAFIGSADFNLYGVDRLTGEEKWHFPSGGDLRQSAVPDGTKYVYVPVLDKGYYCLNAVTGRELWHIQDATAVAGISPDRVYLLMENNRLAAVEKEKGRVTWISLLKGLAFGVESANKWQDPEDPMRVYLVSKDNVLISLKEQERLFKGEAKEEGEGGKVEGKPEAKPAEAKPAEAKPAGTAGAKAE
jgi:outer membrane protein assembly factor BamB